jgi:hypothetical protein
MTVVYYAKEIGKLINFPISIKSIVLNFQIYLHYAYMFLITESNLKINIVLF